MTVAGNARRVSLITLGCARNDVDSEELADRLAAEGWELVEDAEAAEVVMVNTCGFVEQAKRDSIETLLAASDYGKPVVAVGCLAERYGASLAAELPEATVLGFDDYDKIDARLLDVVEGRPISPHEPRDRRLLLPIAPVDRADAELPAPGHGILARRRIATGPSTPVKLASGCDRRCSFCAIPAFRGSLVSRRPTEVVAEVRALAAGGVREVVLVSENSTSYGKDLGDLRLLESLLPELGSIDGLSWVRVSYLQPAEMRPGLVDVIAATPGVARYFDLSFQHASASVLRRMRRFGGSGAFLDLLGQIRAVAPEAGIRSNFIVGFPGETEEDVEELRRFLVAADLDAIGIFGYSDEDGTEAAGFDDKCDPQIVRERAQDLADLAQALMADRAEARVGEQSRVLIERIVDGVAEGRAEHQGPEDAGTLVPIDPVAQGRPLQVGDLVDVQFTATDGLDLVGRRLQ